jgi:NAD(P)-dependent dehydrogenase (short-subunit alcohol dehydrogenase family)
VKEIFRIFKIEGKTAIVTGASKGIGYGIAECLVKAGAKVMLASRDPREGERARNQLGQFGSHVDYVPTDVSVKDSVENLVSETLKNFGKTDILINNAAIINRGSLLELDEKSWDQVIDINLKGYFLCGQRVAKEMIKQGGGKIINVASIRSLLAADERGCYASSKGGIAMLTKAMALEWSRFKINVNAIAPGYFTTQMVTNYFVKNPDAEQKVVDGIPMGRIGIPTDLDGLVLYLASSASDYMTGQIIYMDGGWSIWKF